jgi:two-component sensor histidine kinase
MAWFLFIPPFYTFAIMPATGVALAFYIGVVSVDVALVHWMQVANRRLLSERERNALLADESRKHAERSELLFHELQHRVANNLQMVGAVIGLQKRSIADPAARQSLDEAANKLQLIGSIQRQLYDVTGGRVPVDGFLRKLMNDLVTSGGKPGVSYSVDAQENVLLDPNTLIPLALIMAESVANAIEHGFSGRERGHIAVRLEQAQSGFQLSVSDDGVGIPAGFDLDTASSLGLKIARTLAQQLGGELVIRKGNPHGTVSQLRFSETAAA